MFDLLGVDELEAVIYEVTTQIQQQIIIYNQRGELNQYLNQLPINYEYQAEIQQDKERKILVIGDTEVRHKDLIGIIKGLKLDDNRFEFVTNYEEIKQYNFSKLQYNSKYEFVLAGPMPHKARGVGDGSSMISKIEQNPEIYPSLIRILDQSNQLKITKSSFKRALEENVA